MNKQGIQKRIEEVKSDIQVFNILISQGKYLEPEEIAKMNAAFTELDSLNFKLRSIEDGSK